MTALYITSLSENTGKTMVTAGLGKYWLNTGRRVGYFKPLFRDNQNSPAGIDKDALFIKKIFNLPETLETISPTIGKQESEIKRAYEAICHDKEAVIIEGLNLDLSTDIISALAAKVLIVHDYATPLAAAFTDYQKLGNHLLGIILNKVPRLKIEKYQKQSMKEMAGSGIRLLGSIPEDRILMALSISDLAEVLQGKILNNTDQAEELIENFMMGSSTFDRGAAYYNRKNNKAVILWGERPGYRKAAISALQQAALQTSTRCLVISAGSEPIPVVSQKAIEKQVPLISAPGTIPSLVTTLENAMSHVKFAQEKKLPRLEEILRQNIDLGFLSRELALAG